MLGVRDTVPMIVGAIPFGILFGALATSAGLSAIAVMGLSLLVFAGSAQFIAVTLIAAGTPIGVIVVTTFILNLRHALYAASLGPFLGNIQLRWLIPLSHWLTDETYAVVIKRYESGLEPAHRRWYYAGSGAFMYLNWQICTLIGIFAGRQLQGLQNWGLEFAMIVTFIGIVVPMLRTRPMVLCALASAIVAVKAYELPNQIGLLLAAAVGIGVGYLAELMTQSTSDSARGDAQ